MEENMMLRHSAEALRRRAMERDAEEDVALLDEEQSPRQLMARLTREAEKIIDKAFDQKKATDKL